MIKFVEHKNINKKKWDDCINNSSNASIFAYSWYLDVVCEDWNGLVLGDYEAVFVLTGKSKYKINYLYQPFFTRYFGVFQNQKSAIDWFLNFLMPFLKNINTLNFVCTKAMFFHPKNLN